MGCRLEENFEVKSLEDEVDEGKEPKIEEEECPQKSLNKEDPFIAVSLAKSQPKYATAAPRCKEALETVSSSTDRNQQQSTEGLKRRARELAAGREKVEDKIKLLREEIPALESERQRIRRSLTALENAQNISSECLLRRTARLAGDLIRDGVDEALEKEGKMCSEIRHLLQLLLAEAEDQLQSVKTCKEQLEFDWSDKTEAYRLETINVALKNVSADISFHPGAARLPANQSDESQWQVYTVQILQSAQTTLDRSRNLRQRIQSALEQSVTDLRKQADCVELQLQRNIAETQDALQNTENTLQKILHQITETESLEANLWKLARQVDLTLKVAQTRLYNREHRPRIEQTRDDIQLSLIEEVKNCNASATKLTTEVENAKETAESLYHTRALLQRNVCVKKKSIYVDAIRCRSLRSGYPDSNALYGYP